MNMSKRNWRTGLKFLLLVGLVMGGWSIAPVVAAPFAYVTNNSSNTVSVIDTATNIVVATIPVDSPAGVAITPDGKHAYVANYKSNTVSVIDTATNTVVAMIPVGGFGVAITPDGQHAFVTDYTSTTVSVIDTATNTVMAVIPNVGGFGVAITPDGQHAYVPNQNISNISNNTVSVIDTATNTVVGSPIPVGSNPIGVAITPDGKHAYVANGGGDVSVIDTATNTVVSTIPVGSGSYPYWVAITPDGQHAYVTNQGSNTVSVIDTATNTVVGSPIPVRNPIEVAITPDGKHAYVTSQSSQTVLVIDTATNTVVGNPIPVGDSPYGVAITPMVSEAGPRLARWQQTTALPQPSATAWFTGKPMPIINGRAYLVGGQNATRNPLLTSVYYSTINTDGTLGPWVQTTPLRKLYEDYAVVSIGNYVYLLNGADGFTDVDYALILPDGRIGIWTPTAPLDPSRQNFAAAASGNFIYASGGNLGGTISRVDYTSVNPDGSLNPWQPTTALPVPIEGHGMWQPTTALPVPIEGHGMVATRGRLYVVAPSYVVPPNGAAYYATINPADGTVGSWTPTTPPPAPVSSYSTFESNGYLYLVSGNPNSAYYAQIQGDGALGEWQPTTLLPNIRMGARIGAAGNSVYVAGGYDGTKFVKTVFYSHLAGKVSGSSTGLQVAGVSCINNKTSQTVNVADPAAAWNCEEAGLTVNAKDGIRMTVTGSVDLTAPVGGSSKGLLLNSVRCINDTTRQALTIDMKNLPPSWNCEAAGLQVNSRDMIRMNINGGAE